MEILLVPVPTACLGINQFRAARKSSIWGLQQATTDMAVTGVPFLHEIIALAPARAVSIHRTSLRFACTQIVSGCLWLTGIGLDEKIA